MAMPTAPGAGAGDRRASSGGNPKRTMPSARSSSVIIGDTTQAMFTELNEPQVHIKSKEWTIQLKYILSGMLIFTLLLSVGVTWVLGWKNGNEALSSTADNLRKQSTEAVLDSITSFLTESVEQNRITKRAFESADLTDPLKLASVLSSLVDSFRSNGAYIGFESGHFIGAFANHTRAEDHEGNTNTQFMNKHNFNVTLEEDPFRYIFNLPMDDLTVEGTPHAEYDATSRVWYDVGKDAEDDIGAWTDIYRFSSLDTFGITHAIPIRDESGEVVAVAGLDFTLEFLGEYLEDLEVTEVYDALTLVTNAEWKLITSTTEEEPFVSFARNSTDDTISETANWLFHRFEKYPLEKNYLQYYETNDEFISTSPLFEPSLRQLGWRVSLVISKDVYEDEMKKSSLYTLFGTIGVLVVSGLLSLYLTHLIAQPLKLLDKEMNEISELKFAKEDSTSQLLTLTEIDLIQSSFDKMKVSIQSFSKFVPRTLVNWMLQFGKEARLGVSPETLTIYFSDIVSYSSVSETLEPNVLVQLMAEYLDEMTDIIVDEMGTVDKYIGDAVMAFWNAPEPCEDHAFLACRAAVRCQSRLRALRLDWEQRGLPPLMCRIGLHTDRVLVGNLGSVARYSYTCIGDGVNLASRLEAINKQYGTFIMCSEDTYLLVKDEFLCRAVDVVAVKGKEKGTKIYEVIGAMSEVTKQQKELARDCDSALSLYLNRDFKSASLTLQNVQERFPLDQASSVLLERCQKYIRHPPPKEWNGVEVMTSK